MRRDITESLRMRDPEVIVRGTDRPELFLEVIRVERAADELREVGRLLVGGEAPPLEGKGIVYARTTRAARETARWLADRGVEADYYHGRRSSRDRLRVQAGFERGEIRVVVATNAFGLGIDVPDVRFVVHRHVPASLEAYYQEAGRAGRDGKPARCTLIYRPAALAQAAFLAGGARVTRGDVRALAAALRDGAEPTVRELAASTGRSSGVVVRTAELLEAAGLVERRRGRLRAAAPIDPGAVSLAREEHRAAYEHSRLAEMRAYAETDGCRRAVILTHFGEPPPAAPCGRCDNDLDAAPVPAGDATALPPGIAVGAPVRHPAFGAGVVQRIADGAVTVVFDDEGYRTLDARLIAEEGLLEPG
jgi:ATP-dependent DNA helicase RecQ